MYLANNLLYSVVLLFDNGFKHVPRFSDKFWYISTCSRYYLTGKPLTDRSVLSLRDHFDYSGNEDYFECLMIRGILSKRRVLSLTVEL